MLFSVLMFNKDYVLAGEPVLFRSKALVVNI